ncbi:MAG: energy transducer TonB, partial [Acidobacteriota bacterium]
MPRDMFGDVVDPSIKMGNKAWYTVPLTMLIEGTIVAALIIIPLMAADVLPTPPSMMAFVAAPPPP